MDSENNRENNSASKDHSLSACPKYNRGTTIGAQIYNGAVFIIYKTVQDNCSV